MLYCIQGTDFKKANEYIHSLASQNRDAMIVSYTPDTFSQEKCEELFSSQALLGGKTIAVLDGIVTSREYGEFVLENLEALASSEVLFVLREEKLTKKILEKIKHHCLEVVIFEEEKGQKADFSIFALADAVGKRSRKEAWILLQRAFLSGMSAEQIYGTLFWQVKTLCLVQNAQKEGEKISSLGLNPFVVRKAQGFSKNYTQKESTALLHLLIDAYHSARAGRGELSTFLERVVLSL